MLSQYNPIGWTTQSGNPGARFYWTRMTHRAAIAPVKQQKSLELADRLIDAGYAEETRGNLDAALARYIEATTAAPEYARGWLNLGIVLALSSETRKAIEAYDRALALEPHNAPAHYNRGLALSAAGAAQHAESSLLAAIRHRSNFPDAYAALAGVLESQGRNADAIAALTTALVQAPGHPGYLLNLGLLQQKSGRLDEAEIALRSACEQQASFGAARHALAGVLRDKGNPAEAYELLESISQDDPAYNEAFSTLLLTLLFRDDLQPRAIYEKQKAIGASIQRSVPRPFTTFDNLRSTSRKLRIGYVSGDYGRHAVAFFALPVIEGHDRQSFEVFCYSNTGLKDDVTERFRHAADAWRDIRGTDHETVTQAIRADAIDILVDLSGHTARNRLDVFARKPAPIQVTWLGYLGSTGLKTIDYRLCDRHTDPPGAAEHLHTEVLAPLPDSQWCYRPYLSPELASMAPVTRNGFATFGSFNQFAKLSPKVRRLWSRVLIQAPDSKLLVVGAPEGHARDALLAGFGSEGVTSNRIEVVGRVSMQEYYRLLNQVDIALDSTPYSGATTTCDALWMSVPVISLAGGHSVARSGVSLLTTAGLAELIARTPEQYVSLATALARDVPRLSALRRDLREQMRQSPLMDERRFVRGIEARYLQMWARWCESGEHV
jgi:protein O-GlcNAc transferase